MRPEQVNYQSKIDVHVAAYGKPEVVSLAEDTHVFHFELQDWREAEILFVNKNGHHFRLIKQEGGKWLFAKTWNGIFNTQDWMVEARLMHTDPEALIKLCGVGPQGNDGTETLCLLPKGTTKRRKAVWRATILDVRFDVDNDRFTIYVDPTVSATFSGKLWKSSEAARWCLANLAPTHTPIANKPEVKAQDDKVMMELEGSSVWGMF